MLDVDTDIEARPAGKGVIILSLADELKKEYRKQLDDIKRKVEELGKREQSLQNKEHQLNCKASAINQQEKENISREQAINKREYSFYCDVLRSGHCKSAYVREMGKDFWEDNLANALSAGLKIGKSEHVVKKK